MIVYLSNTSGAVAQSTRGGGRLLHEAWSPKATALVLIKNLLLLGAEKGVPKMETIDKYRKLGEFDSC